MRDEYDDLHGMADEEEGLDDFKNFDPADYLRKRRPSSVREELDDDVEHAERGLPPEYGSRRGRTTSGRRRVSRERDEVGGEDIPVGLGAGILGSLTNPEGLHVLREIIPELGPVARVVLPAVGCVLLGACILICSAAFIVYNSLAHH